MKKFTWPIIALFIGIISFYLGSTNAQPEKIADNSPTDTEIRQSGYKYTNPLLECNIPEESYKLLIPFRDELNNLVNSKIDSKDADFISAYYRDLNNGPWFGINEKEEFSPSSLLKVPILISYLQLAQTDPKILDKELLYAPELENKIKQNILPVTPIEKNKTYPASTLLEKMIINSDNNAATILAKSIEKAAFFKPYEDLSLKPPTINNGEYYIRVKDYATFFRILFNSSYLNREMSEKALELLSKSEFKKGIVAGLPKGITVSHKFGERIWEDTKEKQLHDCGIVYYPNRPYLLCVMTKGNDFDKLSSVIADISSLVYKEVDTSVKSIRSAR